MGIFVPITNTVSVALEFTLRGKVVVNLYHVLSPHPLVSGDLTAIAGVFKAWFTSSAAPLHGDNLTLFNIHQRDLTTAAGIVQDDAVTTGNVGTHTGYVLPNAMALVVSWRTNLAGRSFRGRTYMPAIPGTERSVTDSNLVNTAYSASWATAALALLTNLQGAGYDLVIASTVHNKAARVSGVVTQPTAVVVNTLLDGQRRRAKGSN